MKKVIPGFLLLLSFSAGAEEGGWQCWQDAAMRYGQPIDLLYAIARVETGNKSGIVSKPNKNETYDIGLMQINSSHLPMLKKRLAFEFWPGAPEAIANKPVTQSLLLADACVNLHVGAWILSEAIKRHGYNWVGIGAYNAGSMSKRAIYARKVIGMYQRILQERRMAANEWGAQ